MTTTATVSYTYYRYTHIILYTPFSRDEKREYYNIYIRVCVYSGEEKRKEEKITVGERGKNQPQREKGGTAYEKRRDGRE